MLWTRTGGLSFVKSAPALGAITDKIFILGRGISPPETLQTLGTITNTFDPTPGQIIDFFTEKSDVPEVAREGGGAGQI